MIFFLSVSQIDFPVSRIDYTTDDLSRINSIHLSYPPCSPFCVIFSKCLANRLCSYSNRLHNGRLESNGLESSRFYHFFYPPCLPSCVIFFLSVSQIDFPVSRIDYTTDDLSRIDSNRVDSTTFSARLVRLLVSFFLSVSQIDFPVSRIDYTTDDSSRFDHFSYPPCSPSCVIFSK